MIYFQQVLKSLFVFFLQSLIYDNEILLYLMSVEKLVTYLWNAFLRIVSIVNFRANVPVMV